MECSSEKRGNLYLASLSGQFIFSDHQKFKEILAAAESSEIQHLRLEFSRVEFIDSAGLGMLLLLRDICGKHKKQLTLVRPAGQVKKVFDISRFEHLFTLEV